jgi:hypothetical protein
MDFGINHHAKEYKDFVNEETKKGHHVEIVHISYVGDIEIKVSKIYHNFDKKYYSYLFIGNKFATCCQGDIDMMDLNFIIWSFATIINEKYGINFD